MSGELNILISLKKEVENISNQCNVLHKRLLEQNDLDDISLKLEKLEMQMMNCLLKLSKF